MYICFLPAILALEFNSVDSEIQLSKRIPPVLLRKTDPEPFMYGTSVPTDFLGTPVRAMYVQSQMHDIPEQRRSSKFGLFRGLRTKPAKQPEMSERRRGKQPVRDGPATSEPEPHTPIEPPIPEDLRRAKRFPALKTRGESSRTGAERSYYEYSGNGDRTMLHRTISLPIELLHVASEDPSTILAWKNDHISLAPAKTYDAFITACVAISINVPTHIQPKTREVFGRLFVAVDRESECITRDNWVETQIQLAQSPGVRLAFAFQLIFEEKKENVVKRAVRKVKGWGDKKNDSSPQRHDSAKQLS